MIYVSLKIGSKESSYDTARLCYNIVNFLKNECMKMYEICFIKV